MERYDLRDLILTELRRTKDTKLNERANPVRFDCVLKKHSTKLSAWLGDGAWGCHACGVDGQPLEKLARELGIDVPKSGGFTIEEYADRKRFALDRLSRVGRAHDRREVWTGARDSLPRRRRQTAPHEVSNAQGHVLA
jgi:hypothetical protein